MSKEQIIKEMAQASLNATRERHGHNPVDLSEMADADRADWVGDAQAAYAVCEKHFEDKLDMAEKGLSWIIGYDGNQHTTRKAKETLQQM